MQSINFETGYKEFMINDDPGKVIRFFPSDFSILERFDEARRRIAQAKDNLSDDIGIRSDGEPVDALGESASAIRKVNTLIKEQVDYIFDSEVSDIVFGNVSPLAMVKGIPLFERFIVAAQQYVNNEVKAEMVASAKRVNKYLSQVSHK